MRAAYLDSKIFETNFPSSPVRRWLSWARVRLWGEACRRTVMLRDSEIAPETPLRPALDVQLRRYHRSYRRRLRKLARTDDRLKDLVYTFPAAAFALAGGHGNPLHRADANRLVRNGAALREIGAVLGLPKWVRRVPPEAFVEALGKIPNGETFVRRISNQIPDDSDHNAMWLQWTLRGNAFCDESFALWIARQRFWHERGADAQILLPLAAFAWYSNAEGTTARGLIERPWTTEMSFAKALEATRSWFVRCLSDYCNDDQGVTGRWFVAQRCSGFRIVPLRTPTELTEEGNRMCHCVGDYANQVMTGACLIYSVRRGNDHVATMEVRPHWERKGQPSIVQLRGPENENVGEDITRAATQWLSRQGRYPYAGSGQLSRMPFNEQRWGKLWIPFLDAKGVRTQIVQPLEVNRALEELSRYT